MNRRRASLRTPNQCLTASQSYGWQLPLDHAHPRLPSCHPQRPSSSERASSMCDCNPSCPSTDYLRSRFALPTRRRMNPRRGGPQSGGRRDHPTPAPLRPTIPRLLVQLPPRLHVRLHNQRRPREAVDNKHAIAHSDQIRAPPPSHRKASKAVGNATAAIVIATQHCYLVAPIPPCLRGGDLINLLARERRPGEPPAFPDLRRQVVAPRPSPPPPAHREKL